LLHDIIKPHIVFAAAVNAGGDGGRILLQDVDNIFFMLPSFSSNRFSPCKVLEY